MLLMAEAKTVHYEAQRGWATYPLVGIHRGSRHEDKEEREENALARVCDFGASNL